MAEVKLYIYKGDQKGEPVTQRGTGSFFFDKSTVLPSVKDDVTGTLKTTTITNTYHRFMNPVRFLLIFSWVVYKRER